MRYTNILSLLLISSILLTVETRSQTGEPQMEKGQSGIPLGSPVDQLMCAKEGVSVGGFDLVSYQIARMREPCLPRTARHAGASERSGST